MEKKRIYVFCVAMIVLCAITACAHNSTTANWGSFTDGKTFSYDEKYYALQTVEQAEPWETVKVSVYSSETDKLISSFTPARAFDFWGICWESDTYNIWIQSADIGILCYQNQGTEWILDRSAEQPEDIISKYDKPLGIDGSGGDVSQDISKTSEEQNASMNSVSGSSQHYLNGDVKMTENCKRIIANLDCPYEVLDIRADPASIQSRYQELIHVGKQEGFTPLLILVDDVELFRDNVEETRLQRAQNLEELQTCSYVEQLTRLIPEKTPDLEAFTRLLPDEFIYEFEEYTDDYNGNHTFSSIENRYQAYSEIILAKIPTRNPWELALWVPMGGFNSCPSPVQQAAMFRHWYEQYHAYPAVVSHDIWELYVETPATEKDQLQKLAKEMYLFCEDIMEPPCTEAFDSLAASLNKSSVWYFWWD